MAEDSDFRKTDEATNEASRVADIAKRERDNARKLAEKAKEQAKEKWAREEKWAQVRAKRKDEKKKRKDEKKKRKDEKKKKRQEKIREEKWKVRKKKAAKLEERIEKGNSNIDKHLVKMHERKIMRIIKKQAKKGKDSCDCSFDFDIRSYGFPWDNREKRKRGREKMFREFLRGKGFTVSRISVKDYVARLGARTLRFSATISWKAEPDNDFIKVDPKELKDSDTKKN